MRAEMNKPAKMRSSIACVRCRRSKVKCVNNGMNTKCRTCETQNRECTYPPPATGSNSTPKRPEPISRADGEVDIKRPRKKEPDGNAGRKQSFRIGEDPLETPLITYELWDAIFKLFTLHFSSDLPFLHEPTFFKRVQQEPRSPETQILLLGILSLTARFIPQLVSYTGYPTLLPHRSGDPRPGEPLYASEIYARALEDRLDTVTMSTPSLDTIQASLMLGLHQWGMRKCLRAWITIGSATRLAFAMGLCAEEELVDTINNDPKLVAEAKRLDVRLKRTPLSGPEACIDREIKRRTMWSCFILDRYLATGQFRPQMDVTMLEIQLPCSEEDFRFGVNVKTEFLFSGGPTKGSNASATGRPTHVDTTGMFIRLVDIWGAASKYTCNGGRRKEKHPPWDKRSNFFQIRKQLADFYASLPPKFTFSPGNLSAHVGGSTMSIYCSIHALYCLCQVVINREYIPFIPLRCKNGPQGPIDGPTFPKDKYDIPEGFWEESARHVFSYARDITDIIKANKERKILLEGPQILFAVWTAAFCGVYADRFPWMDQGNFMCDPKDSVDDSTHRGGQAASRLAIDTLTLMEPNMKMASYWTASIAKMTRYYRDISNDYHNSLSLLHEGKLLLELASPQDSRSAGATRRVSLREGGHGGGLAEYVLVEKELKEFGPIEEEDEPSGSDRNERGSSRASTNLAMTPQIKSEAMHGVEMTSTPRSISEGTWAAVNTGSQNGGEVYAQRSAPGSYKPLAPVGQGARQDLLYDHTNRGMHSSTPSVVSSHTAQTTPNGVNSPFGRSEHAAPRMPDQVFPSDSQQHSQQMAEYPSSAQHTQPLLRNSPPGVPQMEDWAYSQNVHAQQTPDQYLEMFDTMGWNGADVTAHRGETPFYGSGLVYHDGFVHGMTTVPVNFMRALSDS